MSEEQTNEPAGDAAAEPDASQMNRAERRAAAKNKKAPATGGFGHGSNGSNVHAHSSAVGGTRLPRTGHKGG